MVQISCKYKDRIDRSYERIKDVYNHVPNNVLPTLIIDVPYGISTMSPDDIPEDYFTDVKTMFDYQVRHIEKHMEQIDDDYIPMLFPWYGIGVVPSAFGCKVAFKDGLEPVLESKVIFDPGDIKKLSAPDHYADGLMPKVLECIDYMKANSDLPVDFTDCQGPLSTAISLCGPETLFMWMYEHPEAVHDIMEFCTEVLIDWIQVQKKHTGHKVDSGSFPHRIALPEGFGGVWISDDDCVAISAAHYKEFVVPYNEKVLKAFGGGTIHFCGSAIHQLENFLHTEGLTGINNFCMGDFGQVAKMQEVFEDRIALMMCDFVPLDIEGYYSKLLSVLKRKGVILASFVAPELALHEGKHRAVSRDAGELVRAVMDVFSRL